MSATRQAKLAGDLRFRGELVSFPAGRVRLDGFLRAGRTPCRTLLIGIHGMHSNFHSSRLKKELFSLPESGVADVLIFNNRGSGAGVETERFSDARADLDAAIEFGRRRGYRHFFLVGHSTGCQKGLYHLDRTRRRDVRGLILLAPCDDYAITRRMLGRKYAARVRTALALEAAGRGGVRMPPDCQQFTARRFLSVADRDRTEAALFDYDGPMRAWRRLRVPVLVLFGTREEYACLPVREMVRRLAARTTCPDFESLLIRGVDHGFHGRERDVCGEIARWMAGHK